MRVVIYGGRNYSDRKKLYEILDYMHDEHSFSLVIDGAARGADTLAHEWAKSRKIPTVREPADWARYGPAAGPIRNKLMITKYNPELSIGFPGGDGTSNMTKLCILYGIENILI